MKKAFGLFGLFLVFFAGLFLSLCTRMFDNVVTLRYRLTIEIETPEGLRIGSGVREASLSHTSWLHGYFIDELTEEAVEVDLGAKGSLFIGTKSIYTRNVAGAICAMDKECEGGAGNNVEVFRMMVKAAKIRQSAPYHYGQEYAPIWFADRTNPRSALRVPIAKFETTIGPGYRFKGATITITDEPLSTGIENRLPWLKATRGWPSITGEADGHPNAPVFKQLGYSNFHWDDKAPPTPPSGSYKNGAQ